MDILDITEEEKKQIGWQEVPGGFAWRDTTYTAEINLEDADYRHLMELAEQRTNWPSDQPMIQRTIQLLEKLNIMEK